MFGFEKYTNQPLSLHTDGIWIRDSYGRVRILRGCNVSGDTKVPVLPAGETWRSDSLQEKYSLSFVGRPFPLEEADGHFLRLKSWGFTFLRWLITWEAVEHDGPGIYDEEYLSYVRALLKKCEEYGLQVVIDPHQDVWSRFTGGDGAPAWTLEAVGIDVDFIEKCCAANLHQTEGANYRQMTWYLNTQYYACATMFTLFFGGNSFAPGLLVDGEPVQEYLQRHYIDAMVHTARRLKDCAAICGFGSMNEPSSGYIGVDALDSLGEFTSPSGVVPAPFETMKAASGYAARFAECRLTLRGTKVTGYKTVNQDGWKLFKEGFECPWKTVGVWDVDNDQPRLLKPDYFSQVNGVPVDFANDFLKPFIKRYVAAFQKKYAHYLFFVEGTPNKPRPIWNNTDTETAKMVDAFHWYDGKTLILKKWFSFCSVDNITRKILLGKKRVIDDFVRQIARYADPARSEGLPPFLGEFGVPYDLDGGKSYKTGNYAQQDEALGMYYDALDRLLLSATVWNYTPSNTNEHGDGWNGEDLSIYSAKNGTVENSRSEKGFCRPYAVAVAGIPQKMTFTRTGKKPVFEFEWKILDTIKKCEDETGLTTEIFVPNCWFPEGWTATLSGCEGTVTKDAENQRLFIRISSGKVCTVRVE